MSSSPTRRAFTIIELLVVVSIVALLIGILLPAIGKARDQAKLSKSQGNLRNLGAAHETYGSEWNDRQFTLIVDTIARYGDRGNAFDVFASRHGGCGEDKFSGCHPGVMLGWVYSPYRGESFLVGYWQHYSPANMLLVEPMYPSTGYLGGFGAFRLGNCKQFNQYVGGRYYDPVFYAPKDLVVMNALEPCLDDPGEFSFCFGTSDTIWTSYALSPAAMWSPDILSKNPLTGLYWQDPWRVNGGFRSPSVGQCKYPNLKTRMLEHHWLQNPRGDCNPGFIGGTYDECEPYYFNHGWESVPVTLFYDGHIEGLGTREASQDNLRVLNQTGGEQNGHGLWSKDTPLGGDYADRSDGGYFMDLAYDWTSTSYHVLTIDGIRGRDKLDR